MDAAGAVPETDRWLDRGLRSDGATRADSHVATRDVGRAQVVLQQAPQHTERTRADVRGRRVLASPRGLRYATISTALPALVDRRRQRLRDHLIAGDRRGAGTRDRPDRIACHRPLVSTPRTLGEPLPFMSEGGRGRRHRLRTVSTPSLAIDIDAQRLRRSVVTPRGAR